MKKVWMRFLPLLVCAVLLLSSCNRPTALDMDAKNGSFTNTKTGVTYRLAPDCYEAISILKDHSVARIKYDGMDDVTLYEIEFATSEEMIASLEGEIFYADGTTLPTLSEMMPERIYIGQVGAALDYVVAMIESADDIDIIIESLNVGDEITVSVVRRVNGANVQKDVMITLREMVSDSVNFN